MRKFFVYLLISAMFCAVSFGGCGGSDNLASVNVQDDPTSEGTVTSGDTSGRGDGWSDWDDLTFETNITGKWRIVDTCMVLGTEDLLLTEVGVTDFQLTGNGNTLTISTLDGQQTPNLRANFSGYDKTRGILTASDIPVLVGGTYSLVGNDSHKQMGRYWDENRQYYYTLEGSKKDGSALSKWKSLKFTHVYIAGGPETASSYTVTTQLVPIESDLIDEFEVLAPLELFSGNWKIVSSKLTASTANDWGVTAKGSFYVEEESLDPYLKTRAGNGKILFAAYNPKNPNQQVEWLDDDVQAAEFSYFEDGGNADFISIRIPIITNVGVYTQDSTNSKLYSTPMFDSNNNFNTVRQTIEAFGSYPWSVVKVTYNEYDPDTRNLVYRVVTTLENISY